MALNFDISPLGDFIRGLAGDANPAEWMWQVGMAALALVLGFYGARVVCRHLGPSKRWKFGEGSFERVAFPLFAWIFILLGKVILARYQSVLLLQIVQSLVVAWLLIRLAAYVLGHVLPKGGFLHGSIRVIAWIAWIAVALHITGLAPEVIGALEDVGFSVGKNKQRITLWLVLQAIAALGLTLALAAWLSRITESRVMASQGMDMSTRVVITKLVRVATMFLAIMVALPLVGIDITALSIFSGALGVGLGFGLQKIASNYVSGFIVLLDHSLRIGDIITVDNKRGEVTAIESRYTVIKGADGVESIIPNEKLITESVNHHTYSDPKVSMVIAVTISYESDVERACQLLVEAAKTQKRVVAEPPVAARVKLFRDHGIDLELTVWITDPAVGEGDLKSDIYKAILKSYREARIEIPYPRRDVRLLATPETQESTNQSVT
jgi:small-conductance mechanosensitive channel